MPRYSLQLDPIYNEGDYARDQGPTRAIGHAIDQYVAQQDAQREERNKISEQGGYEVGEAPPSPMDRMRSVGSAVRTGFNRVFRPGQYEADRQTEADQIPTGNTALPPPQMAVDRSQLTRPGSTRPAPRTVFDEQPSTGQGTMWDEQIPQGGVQPQAGARGGIGAAMGDLTGLGPTYDVEASTGQHYRIPRGMSPQVLAEIIRNQGEDMRNQNTRASAERIARTGAGARVTAAQIAAESRGRAAQTPRAESPSLQASRAATAAHANAETADLGRRQVQAQADQIVQSLAGQNPGRRVTPEALSQYAGGLYRNGKIRQPIPESELYAALDRYHNPPNRAPTTGTVLGGLLDRELGNRASPAAPAEPPSSGGGRVDQPGPPSTDRTKDGARGGGRTGRPDAAARYDQLRQQGLDRNAILRRMATEGYPPPGR